MMSTVRTLCLGVLSIGLGAQLSWPVMADTKQPDRIEVTVRLKRGDYTFHRYVPGDPQFAQHPKAIIIFGSGDGGFFGWEDHFCKGMQALGYEVIGFDCAVYAQTDYDIDILQADFNTIDRTPFFGPEAMLVSGLLFMV
jgi:hypothetical protein